MGYLGAAYGIGFIVGPAVGAMLSLLGYRVPSYVAALLALLNWIGNPVLPMDYSHRQ